MTDWQRDQVARWQAQLARGKIAIRQTAHHVEGWESIPCDCVVCRADRIVDRIAAVIVGLGIGYFAAHLAVALFVR